MFDSNAGLTHEEKLKLLISEVLWKRKIYGLPKEVSEEMERIAIELKVPAREDCVRNYIAAYMVVKGLMSRATADRVVASSSKGRQHWEKKIREYLFPLRPFEIEFIEPED